MLRLFCSGVIMKDYTKAVKDILDENGWCFLRHGGKGKVWMADWLW